jgi:serine phosphatase RsbU (regulator of sigma subunit)
MSETVLLSASTPPSDLHHWLAAANLNIVHHVLGSVPGVNFAPIAVAVIDVGQQLEIALVQTRRWRAELGDELVPIVWILPAADPTVTVRGLEAGADVVLARPLTEAVLLAQLRAAMRARTMQRRVALQAAEARLLGDQLRKAYAQIDRELSEARRVHRAFLPRTFPSVGHARLAVCHRARSKTAGDFYDARRLDEQTLGFFVADIISYEAGSLLGVFVGRSVMMKETEANGYRILPPGEILARVNRELIDLGLEVPPLVAMVAGTINGVTGELMIARAGMPSPVYLPAEGEPEVWSLPGPFLGTAPTTYPCRTWTLQPGDQLVLATDGTRAGGNPGPTEEDRQLQEAIGRHRHLRGQALVDAVATELLPGVHHGDDFTLMVVELTGE